MKKLLSILLILAMLLPGAVMAESPIVNMSTFYHGYAVIVNADRRCGLADAAGTITVPCEYESMGRYVNDGVAMVVQDGLYGYVDAATGEILVPCQFKSAQPFSDGIGVVQVSNDCYRCYNARGEIVMEKNFRIGSFSEGLAPVDAGTNPDLTWSKGYMDKSGEIVLSFERDKYTRLEPFHEGVAVVTYYDSFYNRDRYGYINTKGRLLFGDFEQAFAFKEGLGRACFAGCYGFIGTKNNEVVPILYQYANDFSDGMAMVVRDNLVGYVNTQGEEVIPCQFENGTNFSNGLAPIMVDRKVGFIDKTGKIVIQPRYDNSDLFTEKYCAVMLEGKWGVIDREGNVVVPMEYDLVTGSNESMIGLKDGQLHVLIK